MSKKKSFSKIIVKRTLKCEICNVSFECNSSKYNDCWCFKVPIVKISENIKDCVCKNCLIKNKQSPKIKDYLFDD